MVQFFFFFLGKRSIREQEIPIIYTGNGCNWLGSHAG